MPGNVVFSSPTAVLPLSLSTAFREERTWAMLENDYRDGESQRALLVTDHRVTWKLSKRLPTSQLDNLGNAQPNMPELADFYIARNGPAEVFWFYDPFDVDPGTEIGSNWDAAGLNPQGRHPVRFDGGFSQTAIPGMATADVVLIEVV